MRLLLDPFEVADGGVDVDRRCAARRGKRRRRAAGRRTGGRAVRALDALRHLERSLRIVRLQLSRTRDLVELPALGEPWFFSTRAERLFWDAPLGSSEDAVLVFGRETGGLPDPLHDRYRDRFLRMPIESPEVRSLNLSTSVGIAVYELLRQRRQRDPRSR